jgi:hypothetical protein
MIGRQQQGRRAVRIQVVQQRHDPLRLIQANDSGVAPSAGNAARALSVGRRERPAESGTTHRYTSQFLR